VNECFKTFKKGAELPVRTDFASHRSFSISDKVNLIKFCHEAIGLDNITGTFFFRKDDLDCGNQFLKITNIKELTGLGVTGEGLSSSSQVIPAS
jgi:hypothetical protein